MAHGWADIWNNVGNGNKSEHQCSQTPKNCLKSANLNLWRENKGDEVKLFPKPNWLTCCLCGRMLMLLWQKCQNSWFPCFSVSVLNSVLMQMLLGMSGCQRAPWRENWQPGSTSDHIEIQQAAVDAGAGGGALTMACIFRCTLGRFVWSLSS